MRNDLDNNEKDQLWDLLGQAPNPQPSQFFTQQVMRKVKTRQLKHQQRSWLPLSTWAPVAAAVVALASLAIISMQLPTRDNQMLLADANELSPLIATNDELSVEYILFADLEYLIEAEENALWANSSSF